MSYSSEVLADSPLAYYRLGEASGTTMVDSSGNGRNGDYFGAPTLGVTGLVSTSSDTAARLVGSGSGYAQVSPYAPWMQPTTITVEAWIKPDGVTGTYELVNRGDTGAFSSAQSFRFDQIDGTLYARVYVNSSGTSTALQSPAVLTAGVASHVAFTFDGSNIRIYHNGTQVAVTARSGTLNPGNAVLLIGTNAGTPRFPGVMDEVAIYGTALSAARLSAHYAAATGPAGASGSISAALPPLSASLAGGIEFSGTITAVLPTLGANLSGASAPAGIAGALSAELPPLGSSLVGAYSDTATLAAILPPLSASFAGTAGSPPVAGSLAAVLPSLRSNLAGQSFKPGTEGYVEAFLPALTASLSGDVLGRAGLGLALDSSAVLTVEAALEPEPTVPPGTPSTALHIIAPTVPVPTLVAGRPQ